MKRAHDAEFNIEKLLIQYGLWDRVEKHEDLLSCPLCEKKFENGDSAVFCLGKPIHRRCIKKLRKMQKK